MLLFKRIQNNFLLLKNYSYLDLSINFLLFLFFITILWNTSIAKNCYTLLALIALYLIVTRQIPISLLRLEKYFLWSIAASFIWVLAAYFVNGMPEKGGSWILNRQFRLLEIIPIYLLLRSRTIPEIAWWYMVGLGAIIAGIVGISDIIWYDGWPGGRSHGDTSAIFFGQISLCMAFVSLIGIKPHLSENKFRLIFCIVSVCFGILAAILSGSRGVWVAIPFNIIIVYLYLSTNLNYYSKSLILILLVLIPVILFQFPVAQTRYQDAEDNFNKYYQSENILDPVHASNVGLRLDTWRVILSTIKDNPIFGIGIGGFKKEIEYYVNQGLVHPDAKKLPHTHNQYIEVTMYGGVIGLILHVCIFILPSGIFIKNIKSGNKNAHPYAVAGFLIITAYLIFSLTDLTLSRKVPIIFFGLTVSILLSLTYQQDKSIGNNPP